MMLRGSASTLAAPARSAGSRVPSAASCAAAPCRAPVVPAALSGHARMCRFAAGGGLALRQRAAAPHRAAVGVVAMANPRRSQKVSQQIMREVSTLILTDKRARSAMSPELRLGADSNISTVTSITDVIVTGDLQIAKIYVSFFGDERGADMAFEGLQKLEPYLRSQVGKAMQMRHVPELRFFRDDGAARGGRVISLLDSLRSEAAEAGGLAMGAPPPVPRLGKVSDSDSSDSDVDKPLEEYDSAEEDIILIDERA